MTLFVALGLIVACSSGTEGEAGALDPCLSEAEEVAALVDELIVLRSEGQDVSVLEPIERSEACPASEIRENVVDLLTERLESFMLASGEQLSAEEQVYVRELGIAIAVLQGADDAGG